MRNRPVIRLLSLGDSISIWVYTGIVGGGAAEQFAKLIEAAEFQNLTADGRLTTHVLEEDLRCIEVTPDVITLTIGGNDLLSAIVQGHQFASIDETKRIVGEIIGRIEKILDHLATYNVTVIVNTIYDPTDGDDEKLRELNFPPGTRRALHLFNDEMRRLAEERKLLLCDLEPLFYGHCEGSPDPWLTSIIEPNLAGATQIAKA